jgi:peptidoglycan/xylan/chitin deacetylase (PgdA/CDA1 family)
MALVPILVYHSISSDPMPLIAPFAVDEPTFSAHLDLVAERGLRCLTVSELLDAIDAGDEALVERAALITFDDGFSDFRSAALPTLRARGMASTLYVATGLLRGGAEPPVHEGLAPHMLDVSELATLGAQEGVELGAHSHTHPHLDTLGTRRARYEIEHSRAVVEGAAQAPVATFAYPHGYSGPRVRGLVRAAGYRGACGVGNTLSSTGDDRFALSRLLIGAQTTAEDIGRWLDRIGAPPPAPRESARTIGWRVYRRARAVVRRRPGSDPGWPAVRL